jgi:ABC-type polar amino acid transport system ATPase subunit
MLSRMSCFSEYRLEELRLIVFDDVCVSFGPLEVLKGISLEIPTGSRTVIIGPSGSGKSTLLRTINMFERPVRGEVFIDGVTISSMSNRMLCQARQDIGMVFQNFNLYPHKTVLENLTMAPTVLKREHKEEIRKRAMSNLREVNIAEKADAYPSQLSGGQQQRVAIARALTMRPKIMLFDEPTSALDPEMIQEVLDIMERVAKETEITMLFVTHEMKFAEHIADRVLFLDGGIILEDGTPMQVFHHPKNERTTAFLGKILH